MITLDNVSEFLNKRVAPALRKSAAVQEELRKKLASAEHELEGHRRQGRLLKIADKIADKVPFVGYTPEERMTYVKKAADELEKDGRDLTVLETAANLLGRDGGFGKVSEKVASGGDALSQLESVIMTGG